MWFVFPSFVDHSNWEGRSIKLRCFAKNLELVQPLLCMETSCTWMIKSKCINQMIWMRQQDSNPWPLSCTSALLTTEYIYCPNSLVVKSTDVQSHRLRTVFLQIWPLASLPCLIEKIGTKTRRDVKYCCCC